MLSLEKSKLMLGNIPDKGFAGHQIVAGFGNIKLAVPTGKVQYEGYQLLIVERHTLVATNDTL